MSKLVIIAGIKRSGSTWMYNAARLALNEAGFSTFGGGPELYDAWRQVDYHIIKVHPYDPDLVQIADVIFTSDRDDAGIRGSLKRAFGSNLTDERLTWMRESLDAWVRLSAYHMPYKHVGTSEAVRAICTALGVPYSDELTAKINAVRPPTDVKHDPVTLLFRNHITSR